jgi:hypothetical protein
MKPADPDHSWNRLIAAARRAPAEAVTTASYGFATRVAALALAAERPVRSIFERFALRAVGLASLLAIASVCANFSVFTADAEEENLAIGDDPVALLLGPIE